MSASTLDGGLAAETATRATAWWRSRPEIGTEKLALLAALYFTLFSNGAFWRAAIDQPLPQWRFVLSLLLVMTALHALLLGLAVNRWTARPLLTVLLLATSRLTLPLEPLPQVPLTDAVLL